MYIVEYRTDAGDIFGVPKLESIRGDWSHTAPAVFDVEAEATNYRDGLCLHYAAATEWDLEDLFRYYVVVPVEQSEAANLHLLETTAGRPRSMFG